MSEVTAQSALKSVLRGVVGPAARAQGFKGSAPTWRLFSPSGDCAVVNVQSSSYSSSSRLRCVINLSVAPAVWLDWQRDSLGTYRKTVGEEQGLFRRRLHPTGTPEDTDGWWEITNTADAESAARDMVRQLESGGWPVLPRLLDPDGMLEQVRSGDLGMMKREHFGVFFARAEAALVADNGLTPHLQALLARAIEDVVPAGRAVAERFDRWVRQRASKADAEDAVSQ